MKPNLRISLVALLVWTLAGAANAGENPQATLDAIAKMRTARLAEAKAADKRADFAAVMTETTAKAKDAVKDVDPIKVDLAEAQAWTELFTMAQDYKGAHAVAERWAAKAKGEEKFKAQLALMSADYRLKDMKSVANTLARTKPSNSAEAVRLANLANGYVFTALKETDKKTAMKILSRGEDLVPTKNLSDDKERELAKKAGENLAKTRKVIEENPGRELEALEKERRSMLVALLAGRANGSNTNAAAAAAASREARDAKLAKLVGDNAKDFKPTHAIGDFSGLADLKGKVVVLDFFAHWCGPCKASLPSMRALYDDLKGKGLQVVGVTRFYGYYNTENRTKRDMTPEKELERMKEFVVEKNMNWPVTFVGKEVFDAYSCSGIPHVVVIDKAGKIRKIKVGYYPKEVEAFHKEIEKLLEG